MPASNSIPRISTSSPNELAPARPTHNDHEFPALLRVENRQPLTADQQAHVDAAMAAAVAPQRARDDLRAMQREPKREKSRIRVEKLTAKKNGDTTRMPPTGKAAIALIKAASAAAAPARRPNNSISSDRTGLR
jgi:hypothetical protein